MLPMLPPPRRISSKSLEPYNWTSHHLQKLDVSVDELCAQGPGLQIEPELDAALHGIYKSKHCSMYEPLDCLASSIETIDGLPAGLLQRYTTHKELPEDEDIAMEDFLLYNRFVVTNILQYIFPESANAASTCQLRIAGWKYEWKPLVCIGIRLWFVHCNKSSPSNIAPDVARCLSLAQEFIDRNGPAGDEFEVILVALHLTQVRVMRACFSRTLIEWTYQSSRLDIARLLDGDGGTSSNEMKGKIAVSRPYDLITPEDRIELTRLLKNIAIHSGLNDEEMGLVDASPRSRPDLRQD